MRYIDFQDLSSETYPGSTIAPVMVDVMFEILSINEREIQDSLNITYSNFFNKNFYDLKTFKEFGQSL